MQRKDQKCENCDAWLREGNDGYCRAHPAIPIFMGMGQTSVLQPNAPPQPIIASHFPMMRPHGWCREWRELTKGEA